MNPKSMRVKPAQPGAIVRDPHTMRTIPDEGATVPRNTHWVRRLLHRDVVEIGDEAPEKSLKRPTNAGGKGESK